jgi:serine/threonine-protein kinase
MQQHEWEKVKDVFAAALEQPLVLRAEFIAELCAGDDAVRQEVESLLVAHEEPNHLLEKNSIDLAAQLQIGKHAYDGKRFGSYRILREIGRGGMGTVFLAERADGQFKQEVALKIIRQSFADVELEKHFRRERQILASLNHLNIAKLIDGGVSDTGELFLVMEFVAGETLIRFAERHQLSIEERLQVFLKVCRAVSFAHQNLIVHRDLKPSNIIVSEEGEPRLLDFGLAKLTEPEAAFGSSEIGERTETNFRAFTPAYAAPEQILGKTVTTAADVFSLGVILYELLTNEKPFHFEGKTLEEIIRTATGYDPSLPSRAFKSADPQSVTRQRQLRGDLDNITLKALQKDPMRRYPSVAEFAGDIERHLKQLPISARPNTARYRASRFYQRNRIAVSAALLIVMALIAGLGIALWQNRKARQENARADAVNTFMKEMLTTSDLGASKGYQTTISDILADAEKRLDGSNLSNQPEVQAELRQVIGVSYLDIGNYVAAERNLRRALAEQTTIYGEGSPKILNTEFALASLFLVKADYDNSEKIFSQRFSLLRTEFQRANIDANRFALALSNYAVLRRAQGDSVLAESLLRESLAVSLEHSLSGPADSASGLLTLILVDQGKLAEALTLQQGLVAKYRQLPNNETPVFCGSLTLLGSIQMEYGNLSAAEASLLEGEKVYRKILGPNHTAIYDNLRLQAQVSFLAGRYVEANEKINRVLDNYRQNSSPKYISFGTALTLQGLILNKMGNSVEAEKVLREAARLRAENLPNNHFMTALTNGALGEFLASQKRFAEAEPLLLGSYESLKTSQSPDSPRIKLAADRLVALYTGWGKTTDADKYRRG